MAMFANLWTPSLQGIDSMVMRLAVVLLFHVDHPGIQFEHRAQSISAELARAEEVAAL